jgi:hypothetical protein
MKEGRGETRLRRAYVAASCMVFLERTAGARQSAATAADPAKAGSVSLDVLVAATCLSKIVPQ